MKQMLSVEDALGLVLRDTPTLEAQLAPLHEAAWRVLAADVHAMRTQPPFPAAAMDGYAINDADARDGALLRLIGESAAGKAFGGAIRQGTAVRIFTGAPVPDGAGTVVMQEHVAQAGGDMIRLDGPVAAGRHIRARGLDFEQGGLLLKAGDVLDPARLSLAAAGGNAMLPVVRNPKVAILATGDELVPPGQQPGPDQIVASNSYGVAALARKAGAEVIDVGIAPDDHAAILEAVRAAFANGADILVTLGGASVGDHDLIRPVLSALAIPLGFWKIAMRPGKPLMHGRHGAAHVLGLPGNPVSSMVCAHLFLLPLIARLRGEAFAAALATARLGAPMKANDQRQDYVRARLAKGGDGALTATPFGLQDSSMLSVLAASDCLIIRPPHAPEAEAGDATGILLLR